MAAIGSCWATGSWADPAWAANTWANAVTPPPPPPAPSGGGSWGYIGTSSRRVRLRDEEEVEIAVADVPRLIERIKSAAETKAERKAATRAAEMLAKTQPVIDLDAPWVREFVARVLLMYMVERKRIQQADDDALILLLM